jgi:hypothetical protein
LRLTDADGLLLTCFATNTADLPIADLELRHRRRARVEDRIRAARATGLRNLPLNDTAQNRIWLEIVQLALDLPAWMPMLALTGKARLWEPRRLRLRLFSAAAQLVTTARGRHLRFARHWPWTDVITGALQRLDTLQNPPETWNPAPTRRDSRAAALPTTSPDGRNGPPKNSADRHERSRLGGVTRRHVPSEREDGQVGTNAIGNRWLTPKVNRHGEGTVPDSPLAGCQHRASRSRQQHRSAHRGHAHGPRPPGRGIDRRRIYRHVPA